MKSFQIFSLLIFVCHLGFAQVDRYEMPVDTVPAGGKESQEKKIQMEGQDELVVQMKSLNDSINQYLSESKNHVDRSEELRQRVQSLEDNRKKFSNTLENLEKSEQNSKAMKDGYQQLDELRAQFNTLKSSQKPSK
jgi:vacuolar-type H+-ATPase subunit I/STV1